MTKCDTLKIIQIKVPVGSRSEVVNLGFSEVFLTGFLQNALRWRGGGRALVRVSACRRSMAQMACDISSGARWSCDSGKVSQQPHCRVRAVCSCKKVCIVQRCFFVEQLSAYFLSRSLPQVILTINRRLVPHIRENQVDMPSRSQVLCNVLLIAAA